MKFSDVRYRDDGVTGELTDFEKGEQKIRQVMVRNLLLKKEVVRALSDDSTSSLKGSIGSNCIDDKGLRDKKGIHTKDLY